MVNRETLISDILSFIKNDLIDSISDPINSTRGIKSAFVMTSYPTKPVQYPIITIKSTNIEALRSGMQSSLQDIRITLELRIWARNEKEKDTIYSKLLDRLANIQFTTSTGSVANDLMDFNVLSSVEIDEEGEPNGQVIKSRIMQVVYNFYST